jgi:hypothetical protein
VAMDRSLVGFAVVKTPQDGYIYALIYEVPNSL